jgi:hypothetical protein
MQLSIQSRSQIGVCRIYEPERGLVFRRVHHYRGLLSPQKLQGHISSLIFKPWIVLFPIPAC